MTCGDHRHCACDVDNGRHLRHGRDPSGVSSSLGPLSDEDVRTGGQSLFRLLDVADGLNPDDPGIMCPSDEVRGIPM
jgi:hypothetical protein